MEELDMMRLSGLTLELNLGTVGLYKDYSSPLAQKYP